MKKMEMSEHDKKTLSLKDRKALQKLFDMANTEAEYEEQFNNLLESQSNEEEAY